MMGSLPTAPDVFPEKQSHFILKGPAGNLEVMTQKSSQLPSKGVAVICHPHPLFDGTMMNKVVHTLARAHEHQGINTVRFNFRGVGLSEGAYADGIGETDDLLVVVDWVNKVCGDVPIWLAGFSFGAFVAARGATKIAAEKLITVAPVVENYDFDSLAISCPWFIIAADQDELISAEHLKAWVKAYQAQAYQPVTFTVVPEASHFFHGKLVDLRTIVEQHLTEPG